jgi:putative transposase
MLVLEFKTYGKAAQFNAVDEAIRICQFIRNKSIRLWMDGGAKSWFDLSRYCAIWAKEFDFANKLGAMARQASAERAWASISRFYDNCKKGIKDKKVGYPSFQKDCRSVEYKTNSWKLSEDRKSIIFTDKCGIGKLKMKGTRDLGFYDLSQIKRVRLVKRADGYYVQFCIQADRLEVLPSTSKTVGLDMGLKEFYTDSNGDSIPNPRFLRKGEIVLKRSQRLVSRKVKGSANRRKARVILGKRHLKISRQRKDHAIKLARCVITSNDVVVYEDLRVSNMVKNHCLARSISDASWYQFRVFLEYFGKVFGRITIAVNPAYTSQECSGCGVIVKKSLSTRSHACKCGCEMDRDHNAAINILNRGISTTGHVGTSILEIANA